MSRSHFYFCFFAILSVFLFFLKPVGVGDLSIWTALGQDTINSFQIIFKDFYTVSQTEVMVYPVFVSVLYGLIYKLGGLNTLVTFHALIPTVVIFLWQKNLPQHLQQSWTNKKLLIFAICLLGISLMFVPRPALIAGLFFLYCYGYLSSKLDRPLELKNLLFLAAIQILWVNAHGSFLLLPTLLGCQLIAFILSRNYNLAINRIYTILTLLTCCLINPFGWRVFPYILKTAQISKARQLDEWFPPSSLNYPFSSFIFFSVSALFFIFLIKQIKKFRSPLLFVDSFFLIWLISFFAVRNVFLFFLILPVFIFTHWQDMLIETEHKKSNSNTKINSFITALLLLLVIFISPYQKNSISEHLPESLKSVYDTNYKISAIAEFLQNNSGNIFNSWEYGSDLALSQKNKYFIDTRNIIFSDETNFEYDKFISEPEKYSYLIDKYDFKFFLIHQKHQPLVSWLKDQPNIRLVVAEKSALLFQKNN